MSGNTTGRTGTTTSSTDSGQGSGPFSDAFVAAAAEGVSIQGSVTRMEAPEGAAHLLVCRLTRVASSRSRSRQLEASASNPSVKDFVDALPGGKRKVGYAYQILDPVSEEAGPSVRPVVPAGTVGDIRGTATPQLGSTTGTGRIQPSFPYNDRTRDPNARQ
jgi:hypothetical protein